MINILHFFPSENKGGGRCCNITDWQVKHRNKIIGCQLSHNLLFAVVGQNPSRNFFENGSVLHTPDPNRPTYDSKEGCCNPGALVGVFSLWRCLLALCNSAILCYWQTYQKSAPKTATNQKTDTGFWLVWHAIRVFFWYWFSAPISAKCVIGITGKR